MTDPSLGRPFDPAAPLPGAPDPWVGSSMPAVRDAPPYAMTEMIAAEPALAERLLTRLASDPSAVALANRLRHVAASGDQIVVTGCGTSEHAAQATVELWRDALAQAGITAQPGRIIATQAFEQSLEALDRGLLVAVSHEGGTWATNRALEAARARGAATALITVSATSPAARLADIVVTTQEQDASWCHTVGYLSPILAALAVGLRAVERRVDVSLVRALLASALTADGEAAAERVAAAFAACDRVVVVGSGADRVAARELSLKIEEASYLPATMRDLETLLHGHLPAADGRTGLVLILADRRERPARIERARHVLSAAEAIGLVAGAIVAAPVDAALDSSLTPAGRLLVPDVPGLPAPAAALIGTATPLQLLTERVARARGTNPDTLRRTEAAYREAGERHP